jgi:hypothetical protein
MLEAAVGDTEEDVLVIVMIRDIFYLLFCEKEYRMRLLIDAIVADNL